MCRLVKCTVTVQCDVMWIAPFLVQCGDVDCTVLVQCDDVDCTLWWCNMSRAVECVSGMCPTVTGKVDCMQILFFKSLSCVSFL